MLLEMTKKMSWRLADLYVDAVCIVNFTRQSVEYLSSDCLSTSHTRDPIV